MGLNRKKALYNNKKEGQEDPETGEPWFRGSVWASAGNLSNCLLDKIVRAPALSKPVNVVSNMKSVSNNPERARGLKEYAKKAIDTVWNSISDGIGSVAYSSALKTPYLTRYEIVHGSSTGILDVGANSLGIGNSVDRDLRNELFAGRKKSVDYWGKELEAGRISKTERDIKVAAKIRNLENRYENRLEKFKTDILPVAFNNFLEGIPDEHVVSDDKKYKGLVAASKVSREAGLPSGLASAFLGKYGSILVVDPPRSTPPKNEFAEKKVYEVHEPGFVEREFYKIVDKVFKYPMKAISKVADLMIEHPLLVGAATVTGISIAADFKYNNGKIAKNTFDYAKNAGKSIAGGAASFVGDFGGMFKGNEAPIIDDIKFHLINPNRVTEVREPTVGETKEIATIKAHDPDGDKLKFEWKIENNGNVETIISAPAGSEILLVRNVYNGKVENTSVQNSTLEKAFEKRGKYNISGRVVDSRGAASPISDIISVNVKDSTDFDYWDNDFKVGIMFDVSPQDKTNLTKILNLWKEVDPEDYADKIRYAPKRMGISPDGYSWYGYNDGNDFIQLPRHLVAAGGSDDIKVRKRAIPNVHAEFDNANETKTGIKFENGYDAMMDDGRDVFYYGAKLGLWTQERAEQYLEKWSDKLKSGESWKDSYICRNMQGKKLSENSVCKIKPVNVSAN